jgi:hypothetical protein
LEELKARRTLEETAQRASVFGDKREEVIIIDVFPILALPSERSAPPFLEVIGLSLSR